MHAAANVAAAAHFLRDFFSKTRIRDLVLGAAVIVLLVIVAAQMNLLVPRFGSNVSNLTMGGAAGESQADPRLVRNASPDAAQPVVEAPAAVKKTSTKPPRSPAKQIVIPSSTLDLAVQHQFKDATLYVWVDNKLAVTVPLHGAPQKKLVVFNGVRGVISEALKVPAGKRLLRFRALSTDRTVDLSKTLSAEFVGGDTKSLQVSFEKHNSAMRLSWEQ